MFFSGNTHEHATHGLAFVVAGLHSRWKQIVGYYFTGDSYNGSLLEPIVRDIVSRVEKIGLKIHIIVNDMGSINMAMWKAFVVGIAGRHSETVNSIPHPLDCTRKLWFSADSGHLLKNLKACILGNKTITVPDFFVEKYNLSSSVVDCKHFETLAEIQENSDLKLVPKLKVDDLAPNTFEKMKVNKARHFLSHEVSAGLKTLAAITQNDDLNTTAAFVDVVCKWFSIVTARSPQLALGKSPGNSFSQEKFEETITFLKEVSEIFENIKVGNSGAFKPIQRGIMITTKTVIELSTYLIEECGYQYVLGGRLTSDCIENIFSCIRAKQPIPNTVQFKQCIKVITVSQFLKPIKTSNYDEDDRVFLGDFLTVQKRRSTTKELPQFPDCTNKKVTFTVIEYNVLFNIAGYIIKAIRDNNRVCEMCLNSAGSTDFNGHRFATFVLRKCFKQNTLFFANDQTFDYFVKIETIFRQYSACIREKESSKYDLVHFLTQKMIDIPCEVLLPCHGIKKKIATRFARFRLRILRNKQLKKQVHDSKSMAMHTLIK